MSKVIIIIKREETETKKVLKLTSYPVGREREREMNETLGSVDFNFVDFIIVFLKKFQFLGFSFHSQENKVLVAGCDESYKKKTLIDFLVLVFVLLGEKKEISNFLASPINTLTNQNNKVIYGTGRKNQGLHVILFVLNIFVYKFTFLVG